MTKSQLVMRQSAQEAYRQGRAIFSLDGKFLMKIPYRYVKRNSWLEKKARAEQPSNQAGARVVSLQGRTLGRIPAANVEPAARASTDETELFTNRFNDINGLPMLDWTTQVPGPLF